ncbi:MAG: hypothetical protein JWM80_2881, partial [Cyanobacteria bacterium RYN_339]|nr:hypothetical protein [Cyanobacteria bacterium RYN_339]
APGQPAPTATLAPPADAAEARTRALNVFFDKPADEHKLRDGTNEDGAVQQEARTFAPDGPSDLEAVRQQHANEGLVNDKLANMSDFDRKLYRELEGSVANDPKGQLALQTMLLDGRLTDMSQASSTGKSLMLSLSEAAHAPMDEKPGLNREQLMGQLMRECAFPGTIQQGSANTCTVTSVQLTMASKQPAEYVRIVSGLAKPPDPKTHKYPEITLADGKTKISRCPDSEKPDGGKTPRSTSSKLFESSMMQLAAKSMEQDLATGDAKLKRDLIYDPNANNGEGEIRDSQHRNINQDGDKSLTSGINSYYTGVVAQAATGHQIRQVDQRDTAKDLANEIDDKKTAKVFMKMGNFQPDGTTPGGSLCDVTALPNGKYRVKPPFGEPTDITRAELERRVESVQGSTKPSISQSRENQLKLIQTEANAGHLPSVALARGKFEPNGTFPEGGHQVVVKGYDPAKREYTILNPHGDEEKLTAAQFEARMRAVVYDTGAPVAK